MPRTKSPADVSNLLIILYLIKSAAEVTFMSLLSWDHWGEYKNVSMSNFVHTLIKSALFYLFIKVYIQQLTKMILMFVIVVYNKLVMI